MPRFAPLAIALCLALASLAASALAGAPAVASALMIANQPLPGTFPPFAPTDFPSATVVTNATRGYAIKATGGPTDFIWGHLTGGPPAAGQFFAIESTLPPPGVPSFLPRIGFNDAGATLFSTGTPWSLWTPAGPVASRPDSVHAPLEAALAISGKFYGQFLSTYGISDGEPVWRATWQDTPDTSASNTNVGYSLIRGRPEAAPVALLATGMTPTGAVGPIGAGSPRGFDTESVGFARGNANFIVEGFMDPVGGVTTDTDAIMVLNGAVLEIGGGQVRENSPMLVDNREPDERWDNFSDADVNNFGDYLFIGDTLSATGGTFNFDEVLVVNGRVKLREGDTILEFDGVFHTLGSTTGDALINESTDWVCTWRTAASEELIIVNGEVVAATNQTMVDSDGDGSADSNLADITLRTDAVAISDRFPDGTVNIYFLGSFGASFTQGVWVLNTLVGSPCPADLDGDGSVGAPDLAILLGSWGAAGGSGPADFDSSGDVGAPDLAILLGSWGPCP